MGIALKTILITFSYFNLFFVKLTLINENRGKYNDKR